MPELESNVLLYQQHCGDWFSLQLPADLDGDECLHDFLDACSLGGDTNYCEFLRLEPCCFHSDFEIASTSILNSITSIMSRDSPIEVWLSELNVFSTGTHFKPDDGMSWCEEDTFGSLVVSLPSQFTGGALVTRHQGREVTFDWSSSPDATHWAAFCSDVELEVLPVTSGHQILLVYI